MRLRLRYSHWIPRLLGVRGIVLYPFVLFDRELSSVSPELLAHEMIHVRQVRALGGWWFYRSYLLEYARHRRNGLDPDAAYLEISFEREAYAQQGSMSLTTAEIEEVRRA